MNDPEKQAKLESRLVIFSSLALVFSFLVSLRGTGERGSTLAAALSFGIPIVIMICLVVMGMRVLGRLAPGEEGRGQTMLFLVLGVAAGLGVLFLRLPAGAPAERPTTTAPPRATASPSAERDFTTRLGDAAKSLSAAIDRAAASKWQQTAARDSEELRQLPIEDLRNYRVSVRAMLEGAQRLEVLLSLPGNEPFLAAAKRELEARGLADASELDAGLMRLTARIGVVSEKLYDLMEANWEDWRGHGIPAKGAETAPWQRKARALEDEAAALQAELQRFAASASPSMSPSNTPAREKRP